MTSDRVSALALSGAMACVMTALIVGVIFLSLTEGGFFWFLVPPVLCLAIAEAAWIWGVIRDD